MENEKLTTSENHQIQKYFFLLTLIVFAVYFNSLFNPFIRDDIELIVKNPYIKNFRNFFFYFTTDIFRGGTSNFYRPLQTIIYAIVYHLADLKSWAYHLLNIILHAGNTILLFILLKKLYGREISLFVSLLFGVHPLNTEAITYISGTADPLFFLFGLLAILFFTQRKIFISLLLFLCSLLSKETAIIFPLFLILYDITLNGISKSKFKYYSLFIIMDLIYVSLRLTLLKFLPMEIFAAEPFIFRFYTGFKALLIYLKLILYPDFLSVERHLLYIKTWKNIWFISSFLFFLTSLYSIFYYRKKEKYIFPAIWFYINFFFISNIFIPLNGNFREHWMYPGIAGFFIYSVHILKKLFKGKTFQFIIIILLILYGIRTIYRNYEWKNPEKFYKKALSQNSFWALHYNLGLEYLKKGKYDRAIKEFEKSLTLKKHIYSYIGLGKTYFLKGEYEKAIFFYKKSLEINPSSPLSLFNLSLVFIKKNKRKEAEKILLECIKKNPAYQPAYVTLGNIYFEKRNYSKAIKYLKIGVEINPDDAESHNLLGICYQHIGNSEKAEYHLRKAYQLKPKNIFYILNLAFMYRQLRRIEKAIKFYKKALELETGKEEILNDLAICYAIKGDVDKAIKIWEDILKKNPKFLPAIENLKRAQILKRN